jgi:hypothetical protein
MSYISTTVILENRYIYTSITEESEPVKLPLVYVYIYVFSIYKFEDTKGAIRNEQ